MKISVVLPVYNAEATIKRAINSILGQTFKAFELIVVDDGSTDATCNIVKEMAIKDARIKYYRLTHSGIARALNFGIKMSRGEYIARMDADDISYSDRLELQFNYLETHSEVGLVSSLVRHTGDASKYEGYLEHVEWINGVIKPEQILSKRFMDAPFAHPSTCFRRHLINKYGGYTEANVPEDYELWLRWFHHGVSMHKIDKVLLDWLDSPGRLSRTDDNYSNENLYKVKARYLMSYLKQKFAKSPAIYVWGAGRVVNNRVKPLLDHGLTISNFIDVKDRKDEKFIHFSQIPTHPKPGSLMVLCFVSDRKGKVEINSFLTQKGYEEGRDFLMMS